MKYLANITEKFAKAVVITAILLFGTCVLLHQCHAQTKTFQLTHKGGWIATIKVKKHSNSSPTFAMQIENKTQKYIILEVTVKDNDKIVFRDLIRVGDKRPYYKFKAFTITDKMKIHIRQRTNVRRGRDLTIEENTFI